FAPVDSSLIYFTQSVDNNIYLSRYEDGVYHMRYDTLLNQNAAYPVFTGSSVGFMATSPVGSGTYDKVYTTDGIGEWTEIFSTEEVPIRKLFFTSASNGYVLSDTSIIHRTTDGGSTWIEIYNSETLLKDMFFLNDTIGIVAGTNGVVLRTLDGGITWTQDEFPEVDVNRIYIFNDLTAFAHTDPGSSIMIYRSLIGTGIWEQRGTDLLNVHPNPSAGNFHIFANSEMAELEVHDAIGRIVLQDRVNAYELDLDLGLMPSGVYHLKAIDQAGTVRTVRLFKQ
nr:T9SS type A sorting domain-containing protein [Bacteroidota bacterium]